MNDVEKIFQAMQTASGFSKEQILQTSRKRPLPAIRYMIGDKIMALGYSSSYASKILNIDHATLLHGRKIMKEVTARNGWKQELDILTKFKELCR
jgi:hypothetical protein